MPRGFSIAWSYQSSARTFARRLGHGIVLTNTREATGVQAPVAFLHFTLGGIRVARCDHERP